MPGATSGRANPHRLKPENLCAKRCITYAKANMARARQSRQLLLAFPKLVELACRFVHPQRGRLPQRRDEVRSALIAKGRGTSRFQDGDQKLARRPCVVKDERLLRIERFRSRLAQPHGGEATPARALLHGKLREREREGARDIFAAVVSAL